VFECRGDYGHSLMNYLVTVRRAWGEGERKSLLSSAASKPIKLSQEGILRGNLILASRTSIMPIFERLLSFIACLKLG